MTGSYIKSGNEYAHNCKLLLLSTHNTVFFSYTLCPSGFADLELAYNHGIYLKGLVWYVGKPTHFGSNCHNEVKIPRVTRICEVCSTSHCQIYSSMNCGHHAVQSTCRNHLFYATDQHEPIPFIIQTLVNSCTISPFFYFILYFRFCHFILTCQIALLRLTSTPVCIQYFLYLYSFANGHRLIPYLS